MPVIGVSAGTEAKLRRNVMYRPRCASSTSASYRSAFASTCTPRPPSSVSYTVSVRSSLGAVDRLCVVAVQSPNRSRSTKEMTLSSGPNGRRSSRARPISDRTRWPRNRWRRSVWPTSREVCASRSARVMSGRMVNATGSTLARIPGTVLVAGVVRAVTGSDNTTSRVPVVRCTNPAVTAIMKAGHAVRASQATARMRSATSGSTHAVRRRNSRTGVTGRPDMLVSSTGSVNRAAQ